MLVWQDGKAPTAIEAFNIDWTAQLNGDTIASSSWAITAGDAPAAGTLAINSSSFTTTLSQVLLAAGNLGITYTLTNTVTCASGQVLVEQVQLPIFVPAPVSNLTTLANAMAWLGVTSDPDGKIQRIVATVSTEIQKWLGYNLLQQSYTRTFDGKGANKFFVPDLPLQSVQSLSIDGVSIPVGAVGTRNVGFYNNNNSINLIGYRFNHGFSNVTMTYIAGYASVPADVEQACLEWTKNVYISGQLPLPTNVTSVSAGDTSFSFGGSGNVTDTKKISMPSSIYLVLSSYRRVTQISGW